MFRLNWKPLLIGAVVAVTLAVGVAQADACWGCGWARPGCCGYSTYTPYYSSCCTVGCSPGYSGGYGWYVGYRPGPIRRLLFGPYRWYYGYTGYSFDYGVDTCCTGVGAVAPAPPSQPIPTEAQKPVLSDEPAEPAVAPPAAPEVPEPAVEPSADAAPNTQHTPENSGLLTIYVPYDAKIAVNGLATRSKGSRRQYVSYGLKPGLSYKYLIRAEKMMRVRENPADPYSPLVDRLVVSEREILLTAGAREMVTFGFSPALPQEIAAR
jgi:hypothetical protein